MRKFWMGGAIAAISVAAMAWSERPVRSSESLLGKAQSEFAMKARDALIQRQIAQASAATSAPKSISLLPYAVASLEPVAPPAIVAREPRFEAVAPKPQTVTVASLDASIVTRDPVAPPAPPAAPAAAVTDEAQPAKRQMASLPDETQRSISRKPIADAPVSEPAKADTHIVTPTPAAPRPHVKAAHNTHHTAKRPVTHDGVHRSERTASRTLTPRDLEALRARSPELAAAIARYM